MSFLTWILLGLVAGFLGSKMVNRRGEGIVIDLLLGSVGALAGGLASQWFSLHGFSSLSPWSLLIVTAGAFLMLIAYHALRRAGWSGR
jgi:uncharacterized membrane protein YeaQ/YmgE (transglycosylase-associated protein family)